jgi:hypothetical protein
MDVIGSIRRQSYRSLAVIEAPHLEWHAEDSFCSITGAPRKQPNFMDPENRMLGGRRARRVGIGDTCQAAIDATVQSLVAADVIDEENTTARNRC